MPAGQVVFDDLPDPLTDKTARKIYGVVAAMAIMGLVVSAKEEEKSDVSDPTRTTVLA